MPPAYYIVIFLDNWLTRVMASFFGFFRSLWLLRTKSPKYLFLLWEDFGDRWERYQLSLGYPTPGRSKRDDYRDTGIFSGWISEIPKQLADLPELEGSSTSLVVTEGQSLDMTLLMLSLLILLAQAAFHHDFATLDNNRHRHWIIMIEGE